MKSLKPSMRENKRYLLITGKNLKKEAESAILDYIGALGYAAASPDWIKLGKDSGILSINRESVNKVRGAFAVWSQEISVKKVSGTLKKLGKDR